MAVRNSAHPRDINVSLLLCKERKNISFADKKRQAQLHLVSLARSLVFLSCGHDAWCLKGHPRRKRENTPPLTESNCWTNTSHSLFLGKQNKFCSFQLLWVMFYFKALTPNWYVNGVGWILPTKGLFVMSGHSCGCHPWVLLVPGGWSSAVWLSTPHRPTVKA